uniref:Lipase_3 domain-containing protein n=1 Tax=Strongyloides papillosus TaxID=174720 RepID=A0A0N5BGA9_STREA
MVSKRNIFLFLLLLIVTPKVCENIYLEKEAILCGRLAGAVLREKLDKCLNYDKLLASSAHLLYEKNSTKKELFADLRTTIFEDTTQPGVLIVVEKGSGSPMQVMYQMFSGIFQELVNFMGAGKVWKYTYDVHSVHIEWLLEKLEALMNTGNYTRIIFTGHSLGGGISILDAFACVKAKVCRSENTKVITLGSPRTGDEYFAQVYNKLVPETYRVVVKGDVIPSFPPCNKKFFSSTCQKPIFDPSEKPWYQKAGYYHVGREIYYPDGYENKFKYCKPRYEDPNCSPQVLPDLLTLMIKKEDFNIYHNRYFKIEKNGNPCRFV